MKIKPTPAKKAIRGLCVLALALFVVAAPAQAASSISYNDLRKGIDVLAQQYCSGVEQSLRTECVNTFVKGASAVYFASSAKKANLQIQAACSSPVIKYLPTTLNKSDCGAFATGATAARKILSQKGSSANSGAKSGAKQQTAQAPPISECNGFTGKTKGESNKSLCKRAYRECNDSKYTKSQQITCKTRIINIFKSGRVSPGAPVGSTRGGSSGSSSSGSGGTGTDCNRENGCDLIKNYVNPSIKLLTAAFGLIAVGSLIAGAINYVTSEGDPQKTSRAKTRMVNTVLAILAYAFLWGFLQFLVPGGVFNR